MKRLSAAVLLYLGLATAALAQTTFTMPPPAGVYLGGLQVVTSCGGASLTANQLAFASMDTTGKLCTNGSGGSGGAVTLAAGSVSAGAYVAGALVDGADATQGATTQSVCGTSTGTCSEIQLLKYANAQLASLVSGLLTPPIAFTLNTTPTVANGNGIVNTPSSETVAALSATSTTALGTSQVIKASAGNFYGGYCGAITGGAAGYCIVYNGTAAPSTGALTGANVLDFCYFNGTPGGCSINRVIPRNYSSGIVMLISSAVTPYTYTTGTDTGGIVGDYK